VTIIQREKERERDDDDAFRRIALIYSVASKNASYK